MNNPTRHQNEQEYDISEYIGQLHNEGVLAFFSYATYENINPFDNGYFTDSIISAFAQDFVNNNLDISNYSDYINAINVNEQVINLFTNDLYDIFSNTLFSTNDMEDAITQMTSEYSEIYGHDDVLLIRIISGVAKGTNSLWGYEWNFDEYPFVPEIYLQAVSDTVTEEKKKEEQEELKMADVVGAAEGMIYGGGNSEGALKKALTSSIQEYIEQTLEIVATVMPEEDVYAISLQSYFYHYLQQEMYSDAISFHERYGYKFDDIL